MNTLESIGQSKQKPDTPKKSLPIISSPSKRSPPRNIGKTISKEPLSSLSPRTDNSTKTQKVDSSSKKLSSQAKKDSPQKPLSKTKSQHDITPSRVTTFMRSSSESARKSVQSASGYLQRKPAKETRNTVPLIQKSIKVAPESLAERAKASSEERINKFRKNLTRTPSADKNRRKSSTASESDRESLR